MSEYPSSALVIIDSATFYRLVSLLLLTVCLGSPSFSQNNVETVRFETQVLGMKIGDLTAKKYREGDTTHYVATSKVKFWFFGSVDVEVITHSKYVNDYFVKSHSRSTTNRGDFESSIHWDGKKYVVDAKSYKFENKKPVAGLVKWSSTRAFFDELKDGETFISEVFGLITEVEAPDSNVHSTTINGNENQYFYQSGKLEKVTLEHSVKNFQYKRIP